MSVSCGFAECEVLSGANVSQALSGAPEGNERAGVALDINNSVNANKQSILKLKKKQNKHLIFK